MTPPLLNAAETPETESDRKAAMAMAEQNGSSLSAGTEARVDKTIPAKTRSTIYTPAKVAAARANADRYGWAGERRDEAVGKARRYMAKGLDFLWNSIPPQSLPRSHSVNETMGSPVTGKEIERFGNYPYRFDPLDDPWKIIDPSSGRRFPTNDFGAYYRSGLDEHGLFDPSRADRSLLYNTGHPDPDDPLHRWGVDDGFGWVDEHGNTYAFIAYYVHWGLWGYNGKSFVQDALRSFRDAYLFTGETAYARAGAVMLDRIADLYPALDIALYSTELYVNAHGGTNVGKAVGSIWETFLVKDFLYAYDAFFPAFDDPELVAFLGGKAELYKLEAKKRSGTDIRLNIERGIVEQVFPGVQAAQIRGNNGFHQSALALAAVVYDKLPQTGEWLDFIFRTGGLERGPWRVTGGNMGATFVNDVDRDGSGNEASPGYNRLWLTNYMETADILTGYDRYAAADLYRNPKFARMFSGLYPLLLSGRYMPTIGDTGTTGRPAVLLEKAQMVKAFAEYREPIFAQLAYFLNGGSTEGIQGDIFSPDPERAAADIREVIERYGPLDLPSVNMTGYGFAALRDSAAANPADGQRDLWMYYGRSAGHGHSDTLNIGLHAYGLDLSPDLGYPDFANSTDRHRYQWMNNTISHNTVMVDRQRQQPQWVAVPLHFDDEDAVKLADVEAPDVYPQTELYRRTTAMIRVDDDHSYMVDFFRVKGGDDHLFSFHGAEGDVTTEGLRLVPQTDSGGAHVGTYAGPDVAFEQRPANDSAEGTGYRGPGHHYLKNVDRDTRPADRFSIDWSMKDTWNALERPADIHLRLTMLGQLDDVALADGVPSRNKAGNPPSLKYVLAHREGSELSSLFTSVIEPYVGERYIASIAPAVVERDGVLVDDPAVKAVKIVLNNGRTDYIVNALDTSAVYTIDGEFQFQGFFGFLSLRDGEPVAGYMNDAVWLGRDGRALLRRKVGRIAGTIADFTKTLSMTNFITVQADLHGMDVKHLIGQTIYVLNDGERNAVYRIVGTERLDGRQIRLDIGTYTLIRRYSDDRDFSKGYAYDIAEGDAFYIPLPAAVSKG